MNKSKKEISESREGVSISMGRHIEYLKSKGKQGHSIFANLQEWESNMVSDGDGVLSALVAECLVLEAVYESLITNLVRMLEK